MEFLQFIYANALTFDEGAGLISWASIFAMIGIAWVLGLTVWEWIDDQEIDAHAYLIPVAIGSAVLGFLAWFGVILIGLLWTGLVAAITLYPLHLISVASTVVLIIGCRYMRRLHKLLHKHATDPKAHTEGAASMEPHTEDPLMRRWM
ncbi:TMhelix containing protein [Vibrio phage 1.081.O._10N.286.52.C2]|nr:TMhelix containing protein [Vibrio phage 1.081.O._10N.286.52.C2]